MFFFSYKKEKMLICVRFKIVTVYVGVLRVRVKVRGFVGMVRGR